MNLLDQFNSDGYLLIKDFCSANQCDELMKRGKELSQNFNFAGHTSIFQTKEQTRISDDYFLNSGGKISYFFEPDAFNENYDFKNNVFHSLNKIGHALHDLDPVFEKFSHSEQLKNLSKELKLQNYVIIQSMLILKHAKIGGVVDIHQDATFLYTEPSSCIGFWFALEDATINNGCLWAKPGGHKTTLRSWFKRKSEGGTEMHIFDKTPLTTDGMIPLEVKKGTCIVLHGLLPHYSLPNKSKKSRQAYSLHIINNRAKYSSNNWLQRDMTQLRGFN